MATIANLLISLGVDTGKFQTDLNRADKNAQRATKRMADRMETNIGRMTKTIVASGVTMAGTFAMLSKRQIDVADQAGKLATRLGTTSETISQMGFVAEQTGVSTNTMNMALQRMVRRVSEAAAGSGEAVKALEELGISAQELNKLDPAEQFEMLAEAMQGVSSESDRVRLAMRLFDSEGVSLIQGMQGGAEAVRQLRDQADALGVTISTRTAQQAADFNDRMNEIRRTVTGATNIIVADMLPALNDAAVRFQEWLKETNAVNRTLDVLRSTTRTVVDVFVVLKDATVTLADNFKILAAGAVTLIGVKVAAWATATAAGMGKLALSIRAINLLIKSNPIVALGTSLVVAAVAANKLADENAALGRILSTVSGVLNNQVEQLLQAVTGLVGVKVEGGLASLAMKGFGSVIVVAAASVAALVQTFDALFKVMAEISRGLVERFKNQMQGLGGILEGVVTLDGSKIMAGINQIGDGILSIGDDARTAIDGVKDIGTNVQQTARDAVAAFEDIWQEEKQVTDTTGIMSDSLAAMRAVMKTVQEQTEETGEELEEYGNGPLAFMIEQSERAHEVATEQAKGVDTLGDKVSDLRDRYDQTRTVMRSFSNDMVTVSQGLSTGTANVFDLWGAMQQLDNKAKETGGILEQMADRAGERIGDAFFNLFDSIESGWDGMKDAAQNALKEIFSSNIQKELGGKIKDLMNGFVNAIGGPNSGLARGIAGAIQGAASTGSLAGSIGAAFGSVMAGPIGGQIGAFLGDNIGFRGLLPGLFDMFFGSDNPEIRLSTDQADRARSDYQTGSAQSAFGEFFIQTDDISGDARDKLPAFVDAVEQFDQRISRLLSQDQIEAAGAALRGTTQTLFDSLNPEDIFPDRLQIIADAIDPVVGALSAGFDDLQRKADAFQAGLQILDFIEADFAAALDEIRSPQMDFIQGLQDQASALVELAAQSDGSLESIQRMAQGTQNLRQNIVQFVASLEQTRATIQASIGETIRQLELQQAGGIESRQGFVMEANRLQTLVESIGTLSDPGQIQAVIQQITQLSQQLLGAAEGGAFPMRGLEGMLGFSDTQGLIEFLRGVEGQATDRIDDLQESAVEIAEATQEATRDAIIEGLQPAAEAIGEGGRRIDEGGRGINNGAQKIAQAAALFASGASVRVEVGGWEVDPIGRSPI